MDCGCDRPASLAGDVRCRLVNPRQIGRVAWKRADLLAFLAITIAIFFSTRGQVAGVDQRARDEAARINMALCSFTKDLGQRERAATKSVARSDKFLKEHPEGLPSIGFSAAQLRANVKQQHETLEGQRRTLTALSSLRCDP